MTRATSPAGFGPAPLEVWFREKIAETGADQLAALSGMTLRNGEAYLTLSVSPDQAAELEEKRELLEQRLSDHPGLAKVHLSFQMLQKNEKPAASLRMQTSLPDLDRVVQPTPVPGPAGRPDPHAAFPAAGRKRQDGPILPQIKAVLAVASGKGGVGKSTTAVNLACGLQEAGLRVGLLDADIYGPSMGKMLGVTSSVPMKNGRPQVVEKWGLATMSLAYIVDEKQAMVWRGPMVMGALTQFLNEVQWPELDVLVVDMPPGTGDAQLTLTQKLGGQLRAGGAVIVSTPQDIALLDARRAITLFEKMGVPVLGLIENMAIFRCPHCGTESDIFGHGGAKREAESLKVDFLGEIPLVPEIRLHSDDGTPVIHALPDSTLAAAYKKMARMLAKKIISKIGEHT